MGANIVLALVVGWYLTFLIELVIVDLLPLDVLSPAGRIVQYALASAGRAELTDPAYTEGIGLLLYWLACTLSVGVIVFSWRSWTIRRSRFTSEKAIASLD
jgi:hypothetical protein